MSMSPKVFVFVSMILKPPGPSTTDEESMRRGVDCRYGGPLEHPGTPFREGNVSETQRNILNQNGQAARQDGPENLVDAVLKKMS